MLYEKDGTKTLRRQLRSSARMVLGSSRDPAPNAERAIKAAGYIGDILSYATNGRLQLAMLDRGSLIGFSTALQLARGEEA